uniref:Uncharacterized protein n=1 Tax=Alexandrium catenella TaxID=2925 RepID=A0A7S1WH54_ALECA|mmetsp:Transcript_60902/g.163047  ORF Transcript_60902/g.163047 Transcript_60902/m.163047 type:complete len:262 (+) Transcript_60902:117-902(+)
MSGSDWEILSSRAGDVDFDSCSSVDTVEEGLPVSSGSSDKETAAKTGSAKEEAPGGDWEATVQVLAAAAATATTIAGSNSEDAGRMQLAAEAAELLAMWAARREAEVRAETDAKVVRLSATIEQLQTRLQEQQAVFQPASYGLRMAFLELSGFRRQALNTRYYPSTSRCVNGQETYWSAKGDLVLFLARGGKYWGITEKKDFDKIHAGKGNVGFASKWNADLASPEAWDEWYVKDSYFVSVPNKRGIHQTVHWRALGADAF